MSDAEIKAKEGQNDLNIAGLAKFFGCQPITREAKSGETIYLPFGDGGKRKFLAICPKRLSVGVIKDGKLRINLDKVTTPFITEDSVVFDEEGGENSRLRVEKSGRVTFKMGSERTKRHERDESAKKYISGIITANPTYRITEDGTLMGRFPLKVREESGGTKLHTIVIFDEYAEELRPILRAGRFAEVEGYAVRKITLLSNGQERLYEDIHVDQMFISFTNTGKH